MRDTSLPDLTGTTTLVTGASGTIGHAHYSTAKAALVMHARAAALEYGPHGIDRWRRVDHRPQPRRGRRRLDPPHVVIGYDRTML